MRTTLEVDKELKPTVVRRTLEAKDGVLHVYAHPRAPFATSCLVSWSRVACVACVVSCRVCRVCCVCRTYEALEVRMLRTVVSSFFDMLLLTIDTIKAFGEQEQLPA